MGNSCEERVLALRQQQKQLTEILASSIGLDIENVELIDYTHSSSSTALIPSRVQTGSIGGGTGGTGPIGGGTGGFFSATQLRQILGVTESKKEIRSPEITRLLDRR